ncbi:5659_t:CDS:2 [Paraglomus brasilianum]|uniref:5659_t:CDS:1 n=1 Tax=Paraglomus brasilianum TaxID=144538 RepID=A0A9N9CPZ1_9GLOM|nr:5659_t:CDS:2 [Paraglomus brasilianum]
MDLKNVETHIVFHQKYEKGAYRILDFTKELGDLYAEKIETNADEFPNLCIKGALDEEAVFCTDDATFQLRKRLTTNSMLICSEVPISDDSPLPEIQTDNVTYDNTHEVRMVEVLDNQTFTGELVRIIPKFEKMDTLLEATMYKGPDEEEQYLKHSTKFYTLADLDEIIQASLEEIKQVLKKRLAIELDGYWRYIDPDYMYRTLDIILSTAISDGISLDEIRLSDICMSLNGLGIPEDIARHCLKQFSEVGNEHADDCSYRISKTKVCKYMGTHLLRKERDKYRWMVDDFVTEWQQIVPFDFDPSLDLLRGEYLLDSDSALGKSTIRYFSASELPTSAPERFDILFAARFKWEADDIRTYVEDISFDTMHRDYLLLEHGRLIRGNEGKLWFCGKYKNKRG